MKILRLIAALSCFVWLCSCEQDKLVCEEWKTIADFDYKTGGFSSPDAVEITYSDGSKELKFCGIGNCRQLYTGKQVCWSWIKEGKP